MRTGSLNGAAGVPLNAGMVCRKEKNAAGKSLKAIAPQSGVCIGRFSPKNRIAATAVRHRGATPDRRRDAPAIGKKY
jgi:hypothetical protein